MVVGKGSSRCASTVVQVSNYHCTSILSVKIQVVLVSKKASLPGKAEIDFFPAHGTDFVIIIVFLSAGVCM